VAAQEGEPLPGEPQGAAGQVVVGQGQPGRLVDRLDAVGFARRVDDPEDDGPSRAQVGDLDADDVQDRRPVVSTGSTDEGAVAGVSLAGSTNR
jgi:hypothetical protein